MQLNKTKGSLFLFLSAFLLFFDAPGARGQESVASAVEKLKSADKAVRKEGASELGVLGQKDAVESLGEAYLAEREASVRGEIMLSLGKIRDRLGLATLTRALLRDRGTVFALEPDEVPDEGPLAAIFRY